MTADEIISVICKEHVYFYGPDQWDDETSAALDELESLKLIEPLSNYLGTESNNCYFYVASGNPSKVNWISENGIDYKLSPRH